MNPKHLVAFLGILLQTSACIVHSNYDNHGGGGGGGGLPGDVTFTWSFIGATCSETPEVKSVILRIPGEQLQNNGVYPCLANNYPGIVLHDFLAGGYTYTIEALGYGGERLYVGSGSFTVNGNVRESVDLTPVGAPDSYAYLTWRFPANSLSASPNCTQAGVRWVDVRIDGATEARFDCESGFLEPGVRTPFLQAGSHYVEITAMNASEYVYYRFEGQLVTFSGDPVSADYKLPWAVGGTAISWQLTNGSLGLTCGQAQVQTVTVNFQDMQGNLVYGSSGDAQACDAAPIVYSFLKPGTYRVFVKGYGPNGITYLSNAQNPPLVTVVAGQFPTAAQAVTAQLYKY